MRGGKSILLSLFLVSVFAFAVLGEEKGPDFYYKISKHSIEMTTQGNHYLILPSMVKVGYYMVYFAAKDFTNRADIMLRERKDVKVVVDKPDQKVIKAFFSTQDANTYQELKNYDLELILEIRKNLPCLILMSKFRYLGGDRKTVTCGNNWGISDSFQYYTIVKGGKAKTFKLPGKGVVTRRTKIGVSPWIYASSGEGEGVGLITNGLLGKQEDYIYVNYLKGRRQKKALKKGESMDIFMILLPIKGGYKPLADLYEKVKTIEWNY